MFCEVLSNLSPVPKGFIVAEGINQSDDESYGVRIVEHYELEYTIKGSGYVSVDGVHLPAIDHALHFRRPGMVVEGVGIYCCHYVEFDLNESEEVLEELNAMPNLYMLSEYAEVQNLFALMFQEYYNDSPIRLLTFKIHITQLFVMMINDWYHHTQNENSSPAATESIRRSLAYIQAHFSEPLTVSVLADQAGYSIYHYTRLFKVITQWTPIQYLNRCRINYARQILAETKMTTNEVLFACGFNSYSYFFRIFKEQCGISPAEYKRRHQL